MFNMHMLGLIQLLDHLISLKDKISINSKTFKPNEYEEKIIRKILSTKRMSAYRLEL